MSASWESIFDLSEQLGRRLLSDKQTLATAESCTGGGIGYAITHVHGSSLWYTGGVNAYANQIKFNQLGVDRTILDAEGAVSEPVAEQMVAGVAALMATDISVSTSGIAGPDGGTAEKPVGTVCFGWFIEGSVYSSTQYFSGDRESIRLLSIEHSLKTLLERL